MPSWPSTPRDQCLKRKRVSQLLIDLLQTSDFSRATKAPLVLGLIAATYGISLLVLLYVDLPLSRWRERWVARQIRPPATVAESLETEAARTHT